MSLSVTINRFSSYLAYTTTLLCLLAAVFSHLLYVAASPIKSLDSTAPFATITIPSPSLGSQRIMLVLSDCEVTLQNQDKPFQPATILTELSSRHEEGSSPLPLEDTLTRSALCDYIYTHEAEIMEHLLTLTGDTAYILPDTSLVGCITDNNPANQVPVSLASTLFANCTACSEIHYVLVDIHETSASNSAPSALQYMLDNADALFGYGAHVFGFGALRARDALAYISTGTYTDPVTNEVTETIAPVPLYGVFGHVGSASQALRLQGASARETHVPSPGFFASAVAAAVRARASRQCGTDGVMAALASATATANTHAGTTRRDLTAATAANIGADATVGADGGDGAAATAHPLSTLYTLSSAASPPWSHPLPSPLALAVPALLQQHTRRVVVVCADGSNDACLPALSRIPFTPDDVFTTTTGYVVIACVGAFYVCVFARCLWNSTEEPVTTGDLSDIQYELYVLHTKHQLLSQYERERRAQDEEFEQQKRADRGLVDQLSQPNTHRNSLSPFDVAAAPAAGDNTTTAAYASPFAGMGGASGAKGRKARAKDGKGSSSSGRSSDGTDAPVFTIVEPDNNPPSLYLAQATPHHAPPHTYTPTHAHLLIPGSPNGGTGNGSNGRASPALSDAPTTASASTSASVSTAATAGIGAFGAEDAGDRRRARRRSEKALASSTTAKNAGAGVEGGVSVVPLQTDDPPSYACATAPAPAARAQSAQAYSQTPQYPSHADTNIGTGVGGGTELELLSMDAAYHSPKHAANRASPELPHPDKKFLRTTDSEGKVWVVTPRLANVPVDECAASASSQKRSLFDAQNDQE